MTDSALSRKDAGFTLIEIMVALVIFSILSVTLLVRLGDGIRSEQYLEEKTLASVVAENVLTEMRLKKDWSAVRSGSETVEFAGRKWEARISVKDTADENLRQVDVQVSGEKGRGNASYLLTGFMGNH